MTDQQGREDDPLALLAADPVTAPTELTRKILRAAAAEDVAPRPDWLGWLVQGFWRPALSAMIPVVLGYVLGLNVSFDEDLSYQNELFVSAEAIDLWLEPMENEGGADE